jgi:hypothetical protein
MKLLFSVCLIIEKSKALQKKKRFKNFTAIILKRTIFKWTKIDRFWVWKILKVDLDLYKIKFIQHSDKKIRTLSFFSPLTGRLSHILFLNFFAINYGHCINASSIVSFAYSLLFLQRSYFGQYLLINSSIVPLYWHLSQFRIPGQRSAPPPLSIGKHISIKTNKKKIK